MKMAENMKKYNHLGTKVHVMYEDSSTGTEWVKFIEDLFVDSLPEEHRDLNLDVTTIDIDTITEEKAIEMHNSDWRIVLLTAQLLEVLKNPESMLVQRDLMNPSRSGVIVLLLGNQHDIAFQKNVTECFYMYTDFENFHKVPAKNATQIFNNIITILSPVSITPHPNVVSSEDKQGHITFISNKPYKSDQNIHYTVEFDYGEIETGLKSVEGILFNPYTLLVQNPGHTEGIVTATLYSCLTNQEDEDIEKTQLGGPMKVWFQSDLDKLHSILEKQDPIQFLCQALNIKGSQNATREKVDRVLVESFKKNVPENKLGLVFGSDQGFDGNQDIKSNQYSPTLLHFAAIYGLGDLASCLLQCPGALRAFGTSNCDDDYPTTLAEKFGHWELQEFMTSYMQVSALVDDEYGSDQTSQLMSTMVQGQYIAFDPSDVDPIYLDMDSDDTNPRYLPMKPVGSPFIVPIGEEDSSGNFDSIIKKMIESGNSEEVYEKLTAPMRPAKPEALRKQSQSTLSPCDFEELPNLPPPPLPPPREGVKPRPEPHKITYGDLDIQKVPSLVSPAQNELIMLQQKVKNGELSINQAVLRFKEWGQKHKERAASFQYQQERLDKIRQSIIRRKGERKNRGDNSTIKISQPLAAGSSTYDRILMKTNSKSDGIQSAYGTVEKPRPIDRQREHLCGANPNTSSFNEFARTSSIKHRHFNEYESRSQRGDSIGSTGSGSQVSRSSHSSISSVKSNMSGNEVPPLPPRDDKPVLPPRKHMFIN